MAQAPDLGQRGLPPQRDPSLRRAHAVLGLLLRHHGWVGGWMDVGCGGRAGGRPGGPLWFGGRSSHQGRVGSAAATGGWAQRPPWMGGWSGLLCLEGTWVVGAAATLPGLPAVGFVELTDSQALGQLACTGYGVAPCSATCLPASQPDRQPPTQPPTHRHPSAPSAQWAARMTAGDGWTTRFDDAVMQGCIPVIIQVGGFATQYIIECWEGTWPYASLVAITLVG